MTYGAARPTPSEEKTAKVTLGDWPMAYPRALPMNGAVQGLATTTASSPVSRPGIARPGADAAESSQAQPKLEHTAHAECECQHEERKHCDNRWRLKLESPPEVLAYGL